MAAFTSITGLIYLVFSIYAIAIIFQVAKYLKVRTQDMEEKKQRDEELLAELRALRSEIKNMK